MIGSSEKVDSSATENKSASLLFSRLYRAHVQPARDSRGPEVTVFVEAASHHAAIRKICNAVAAIETRLPAAIEERIYNVCSARELIDEGLSEDRELRLLETGWCGEKAVSFVEAPLFLVSAPALIRKWATLAAVQS